MAGDFRGPPPGGGRPPQGGQPPRRGGSPGWANQPRRGPLPGHGGRPMPPPSPPQQPPPQPPPARGRGPLRKPPPGRAPGNLPPAAPPPRGGAGSRPAGAAGAGPPAHPASQAPRDGRVTKGPTLPDWRRMRGSMRGRWKAVLIVLLVAIVGFGVYLDQNMTRVEALPADSEASSSGTNYLIVGSDSREGLSGEDAERLATGEAAGQRTDTIMLLHTGSSGSVLVSIPRDSLVPIPGHGNSKINAAFAIGGPQLLTQSVEEATGLRVDHYVEVGFGGFVGAVDAVGGVDMCVEEAIDDPKAGLDIEAGCQELDGPTALGYVRTRATAGSDFDRVQRQREFLSALLGKATSPLTLINPFRMVPLASAVTDTITVDDGDHIWNLAGLAWGMKGVAGGDGVQTTVPIGGSSGSGLKWDRSRSQELFGALQQDEAPPASSFGP
ncbi:transcriptional attenuator, LytR family [Pseudonocardia ammonioxydans]|uniref:Transcriptional attenuator, LytR family n=1 Tax=Pseudonocardia ammonioxydans TaxID=260086 RepID=A0A1I5D9D3_PSUAM|nr:LCP family protein [Pseudonocardia ammonioxydans]SFN95800.1 transcriptional attenuator, LytR family [Pseudonocardia ammonioxydans]